MGSHFDRLSNPHPNALLFPGDNGRNSIGCHFMGLVRRNSCYLRISIAARQRQNGYDGEALRQKHAAYNIIPTTIEKTMTPLQLFKADNLLWTLSYSGEQVALVNHALRDPLNNATAKFVFNALDAGVRTTSELIALCYTDKKEALD